LIAFSLQANALAEYGFLLESKNPVFSYYALYPKSCAGFAGANAALAKNARSDFAFEKAMQSLRDLGKAKTYALLQPKFLTLATLAAYRTHSINCFSYGLKALRGASEAAREGLEIIDAHSQKLERMIGPGFQGFAGGVVQELGEAKKAIERRDVLGSGFGSVFSKTIPSANQTQSSHGIAAGVRALAGEGGLYEKEIALDDKVLQAIFLLEREFQKAGEENSLLKTRAKLLRDFLESEKISGVGENAFYLVGGAEGIASEQELGSFEKDFRKAVERDKTAAEKAEEAKRDWEAKEAGYASRAIEKLAQANAALKEERQIFESLDERSETLEKSLRQKVLAEKSAAQEMLLHANAFAAAKARVLLAKALEPSRLSTRGERISFYAGKIAELRQIQGILQETASAQALRDSVKRKAELLKEFLARASKDAPLEFEERKLGEILLSVESATPEESVFFNAQLDSIRESALAKLYERYAGLDDSYAQAERVAPFLGEAANARFAEVEQFFSFGAIDLQEGAGRLSKIQGVLDYLRSQAKAKAPALLKKHLQEQASVERQFSIPVAGLPTQVKTRIVLKNLLPLGTSTRIQLDFEVPENASVRFKSPEVEIAKSVFLNSVEEGGEYSMEFEASEEIARITQRRLKAPRADFVQAVAEETVELQATEETQAIVILDEPFPLESAQAQGALQTEFYSNASSSQVRMLVQAHKGLNIIQVSMLIPQPVELLKTFTARPNSSEFEFRLQSKFLDLQRFEGEIAEESCEGKATGVRGSLNAKAENKNGLLLLHVDENNLKRLETRTAAVSLDCVATAPSAEGQIPPQEKQFDYALAAILSGELEKLRQECGECAIEAEKQLLLGNLAQANAELEKGRMLALQKREKQAEEKQAFETAQESFREAQENALQAIGLFDSAFAVFEESKGQESKSLLYQQGKKAKAELEKLLSNGGKAKTAAELAALNQRIEAKAEAIAQTAQEQKQNAGEEIALAELKQRQFGTQETLDALAQAKDYDGRGNAFTAWAIAKKLNSALGTAGERRASEENNALVLGAAGALVLIALAFFFLRNKRDAQQTSEDV